MGEMISVHCNSCDYTREASVGVGMLGVGDELCPCYTCRKFVMKKVNHRNGIHPLILKCPYCRNVVKPIKQADRCAACGGRLSIESIGMWD